MRLRVAVAIASSVCVLVQPMPAFATEPDPGGGGSTPAVTLPLDELEPMVAPETVETYLPPPVSVPDLPAQQPAEIPVVEPTEGWTVSSHWVRNPDGTMTGEFYTGPEFRPVGSGWERIDPSVVPGVNGRLASPGSLVPTVFGVTSAALTTFTLPDGPVVLSALDAPALLTPVLDGPVVEYAGVGDDADLTFDVGFGGVKTGIVLKSQDAPRTWRFHLSDPLDALGSVSSLGGGRYRFANPVAPDTYFELAAPFAYEKAVGRPNVEPGSAHQTVTPAGDGYDITLSVDEDWIEGKTFPIVLDPIVTWQNNDVTSYVNSRNSPGHSGCGSTGGGCSGYIPPASNPNALGAATQTEKVGTVWNIDARPARSFYRANLAQIMDDSSINSASLILYQNGCFGFDAALYECDEHSYTHQHFLLDETSLAAPLGPSDTYDEHAAAFDGQVLDQPATPMAPFAPGTRRSWTFNVATTVAVYITFQRTFSTIGIGQKLSSEPASPTNIGGPSFAGPNDPSDPHPRLQINWTPPPGVPGNVTATKTGLQSLKVDYTSASVNGGPAIQSYTANLYRASDDTLVQSKSCLCFSQSFTALPYGTYYARVFADNGVLAGPESAKSNNVTLAPAPVLTKTVSPATGPYSRGQELTFTLRVTNPDATAAMPVTSVTDTLPAVLTTDVSSVTVGGVACANCTLSGSNLTVGAFSVPAGGVTDVVYRAVAQGVDRACTTATNAATAVNSLGSSSANLPVTICDAALGVERWWNYVSHGIGPHTSSRVNVANGNLVVQATDGVPVQARGRLAYVLRRTYNSQDIGVVSLPGGIGAGWQLNLGETGDLAGAGIDAGGLSVPPVTAAANPVGVTVVDRDGTRHPFTLRTLTTPVRINDLTSTTSAVAALVPKVLSTSGFQSLCVDAVYDPPPGVEMSLWRYVGVSSATCGATNVSRQVVGFAAERLDRIRYEFAWDGKLVEMNDGSGVSLRYQYDNFPFAGSSLGKLRYVYEPRSCTNGPAATSSCRAFRITYPSSTAVHVEDPSGGVTKYLLDGATPVQHLVTVVNPPESRGTVASDRWTMTYHGFGGASCGGTTGQLCSVTDPRGATTRYTYSAATLGPAKVTTVTDRMNTPTSITYNTTASPEYVTADTGTHRTRFLKIDARGRVRQVDEGNTSDVYRRQTFLIWDRDTSGGEVAIGCRQGDSGVHNDLCRTVRRAVPAAGLLVGNEAPVAGDEDTSYTYNAEGMLLIESRKNPVHTPNQVTTTYGYETQYIGTGGSTLITDTPTGGGNVSTGTRPAPNTALYVVGDRVSALPPRGNLTGATVSSFLTTYDVANYTSTAPNKVSSDSCTFRNSGVICSVSTPHTATQQATTTHVYDSFGQRTSTRRPRTEHGLETYTYTYYGDTDYDVSGWLSAGGWLKAVSDPKGQFVAFGYDRAGRVVRTWDRNATKGHSITEYPGYAFPPPSYTEVVHGSLSEPWRYPTSQRDQLGNTTTRTYDNNGNTLSVRSPRSLAVGDANWVTTMTYDAADRQLTTLRPEQRTANKPSTNGYDIWGNRTSATDPNGNVTTYQYDSVNRLESAKFTRGTDLTAIPSGCTTSGAGDAPIPANHVMCSTATSYDGVDNATSASDAADQVTTFLYDSLHRRTYTKAPRNHGGLTWLETYVIYDVHGNQTTVCSPRQITEGGGGCTSTSIHATHVTYDVADRPVTATTYRAAGQPQVTTTSYDLDGNVVSTVDANGRETTRDYDILGRLVVETTPRAAGVVNSTAFEYDPAGNRTAVVQPDDTTSFGSGASGDLVVDGSANPYWNPFRVPAGASYRNVTLTNGGYISAHPISEGGTGRVVINATGTVSVCSSCAILAIGAGHPGGAGGSGVLANGADGQGPGPGRGGAFGIETGGGGGGGGGRQGSATAGFAGAAGTLPGTNGAGGAGGTVYGGADITSDGTAQDFGSGGGGGGMGGIQNGGVGGAGGGAIRITAARVVLRGGINAGGGTGAFGANALGGVGGNGGAGGGGTIWITTQNLHRPNGGSLSVEGGYALGSDGGGKGGNGAPGAIRVDAASQTGASSPASVPISTHQLGTVTAFSYDAANRLLDTVHGSDSRSAASAGVVTADGGGNVRQSLAYDPDGNVVAQLEPRAFATSTARPSSTSFMTAFDYDKNGRLVGEYRPRYDSSAEFGDVSPSTVQSSQCTTAKRPAAWTGVPAFASSTAVCAVRHAYDHAGNQTRTTFPTSTGTDNRYVEYTYTEDNLVQMVTTPDPSQVSGTGRVAAATYRYDATGRVVKTIDTLLRETVVDYTSDGLVKKQTSPPGTTTTHETFFGYDANGNPTTTTDALTRTTTSQFNADGTLKQVTDTGTNTTKYGYDAVGNVTQVTSPAAVWQADPNPSGTPTTYTYTHDNLLLTTTEPITGSGNASRRTTYAYDPLGRKTSATTERIGAGAANGGTQQFAYYRNGLLRTETGRGGNASTTVTYDPAGRAKSMTATPLSGSPVTTTLGYYLDGLVKSVTQSGRSVTYAYDAGGSLVLRDELVGSAHTRTTYAYGDSTRLASSASDLIGSTSWAYDTAGRPATQNNLSNNTTITLTYHPDDTLATHSLAPTGSPGSPLAHWRYEYDALYRATFAGLNVAPTATCAAPIATGVQCYEYDTAGRLSRFKDSSTDKGVTYDANGNRKAFGAQQFAYNADNTIFTATDPNGQNQEEYEYDAVGRLKDDGDTTSCYDGLDRLVSSRVGSGQSCTGATTNGVDFVYDAADRQVQRTEAGASAITPGTTTLHYDGVDAALLAEAMPGGAVTRYALAGASPLGLVRTGTGATTQLLTGDGRGNISTATNTAGAVACRLRYTPFGSPIGAQSESNPCSTGSTPSSVLFGGQRRDGVTGQYQLGSRTYDPDKAAFLTPDTYRGAGGAADVAVGTDPLTANRYTYVNGDPVNLSDPYGHRPACPEDGAGAAWHCHLGKVSMDILLADYWHHMLRPKLMTQLVRCLHKQTCNQEANSDQLGALWDTMSRGSDCSDVRSRFLRGMCQGAMGVLDSIASTSRLIGTIGNAGYLGVTGQGDAAVAELKSAGEQAKDMAVGTVKGIGQLGTDLWNTTVGYGYNRWRHGADEANARFDESAGRLTVAAAFALVTRGVSAIRHGPKAGTGLGPWSNETLTTPRTGGAVAQSNSLSCVAACGEMLSGGAMTQAGLIESLGLPGNARGLARELGDGWGYRSFADGEVATFVDTNGTVGVTLKVYGQMAHMVVVERLKGGRYLVRDPWGGVSYEVSGAWLEKYGSEGVYAK